MNNRKINKFFIDGKEVPANRCTIVSRSSLGSWLQQAAEVVRNIKSFNGCYGLYQAIGGKLQICDRVIQYSKTPSNHKCDARCRNAKGNQCECECGGANHGIGSTVIAEQAEEPDYPFDLIEDNRDEQYEWTPAMDKAEGKKIAAVKEMEDFK